MTTGTCYVTRKAGTGRNWDKPALGQYCFNGSRDNNIAAPYGKESAVFRDDGAPPEERYKCFDFDKLPDVPPGETNPYAVSGLYGAVSPDAWPGVGFQAADPLFLRHRKHRVLGILARRKLTGYFLRAFLSERRIRRPRHCPRGDG